MQAIQTQKCCEICNIVISKETNNYSNRKICPSPQCFKERSRRVSHRHDKQKQEALRQKLIGQGKSLVACAVCGEKFEIIQHTHLRQHQMTIDDYKRLYPDFPMISTEMLQKRSLGSMNQSRYLTYDGKPMDEKFQHFMVGTMLGDGSLEKRTGKKNARYAEGGNNQIYLDWKYNFLRQYLPCSFTEKLSSPHVKSGKRYLGWWIKTCVHPDLTEIHKLWYPNQKSLPYLYLDRYFNEFSLAIWLCDDGHVAKNGSQSFLYTQSFTLSEVEWLWGLLTVRYKLKNTILFNRKNQPFIRFNRQATTRLKAIVSQFKIPGMEYKYQ